MDDNPEIRDRLNVNKSTYHNKRPRERFICFIRGAKWTKINHLNGPSPIHDTSTWLRQSIQTIRHVCCRLGMPKNLSWKCFRTAFGHYDFPSTSASQQAWRMRKRYHLLFHPGSKGFLRCGFTRSLNQQLCQAGGPNKGEKAVCGCTAPGIFARWHLGKAITSIFSVIVIWVYFCYRFSQRCARC